jgi:4-hydroxythreonine-4-phosphate dehydrogenase
VSEPAPLPLALTMGEPAGIGGEIALKAWQRRHESIPVFAAIDNAERLAEIARQCRVPTPVRPIADLREAAACFASALPVLPQPMAARASPGRPSPATAADVIRSIETAVALVRSGAAGAVVTNPIQKQPLYEAGFPHPGHTEFLGALAGLDEAPVMMLATGDFRVVPVTIHVPLAEVPSRLSRAMIVRAGRIAADALSRDFGVAAPRLAVAGLNPHAGEGGTLGREDGAIVAPAVAELRQFGIDARGPHPPDTMFHPAARATYDAALCMYHDQALIPLKTIDFEHGVNITLGLPFIRTSPDHGTALDIAGKGIASPASLIAALRLAGAMAASRRAAGARA